MLSVQVRTSTRNLDTERKGLSTLYAVKKQMVFRHQGWVRRAREGRLVETGRNEETRREA